MKDERDKLEYPDMKRKPVVLLKIKMKRLCVQLFASVMRMSMSQLVKNWEVYIKASCHASIKLANMNVSIITNARLELMFSPNLNAMSD